MDINPTYRFWFSHEQKKRSEEMDCYSPDMPKSNAFVTLEICGEKVEVEYTECCDITLHPNYKHHFKDAIILGEASNANIRVVVVKD